MTNETGVAGDRRTYQNTSDKVVLFAVATNVKVEVPPQAQLVWWNYSSGRPEYDRMRDRRTLVTRFGPAVAGLAIVLIAVLVFWFISQHSGGGDG